MVKNICILFGSPHNQGHTSNLLKYFLEFLAGYSVNIVSAYRQNVKPCIGCEQCLKSYTCIFRDMDEISNNIISSDLLIIASPVYNASFPAPLKSIFDRLQKFYFARNKIQIYSIKKKSAVVLLTQGSEKINYWPVIDMQLAPIFKLLNAKFQGKLVLSGTDNKNLDIDKFYIKSKNKIKDIMNNLNNII